MKKTPKSSEPAILPNGTPVSGKLGMIVKLLMRAQGADVSDMMAATGWQQHSVRGALAGALKRQRGVTITSEKQDGPRVYRIVAPPPPPTPAKAPHAATTAPKGAAQPKPGEGAQRGAKRPAKPSVSGEAGETASASSAAPVAVPPKSRSAAKPKKPAAVATAKARRSPSHG